MPRFVSAYGDDVNYWATPEFHAQIEEWLARVAARYGAEEAHDEINYIVKVQRAEKGKDILRWLERRFSGQAPLVEASDDAELVDVSALLAQAFGDSNAKPKRDPYFDPYSDPDFDG